METKGIRDAVFRDCWGAVRTVAHDYVLTEVGTRIHRTNLPIGTTWDRVWANLPEWTQLRDCYDAQQRLD